MITICIFVIWYSSHGYFTEKYVQRCNSCHECGELVNAYLEAGPPEWLAEISNTVIPMCIRREEEARPT